MLPGPKNPTSKYYEARKRGKFKNNNQQYSTSSNPQRASKNDREKRKAKFEYDLIQFEYYYQRRKAVRKVLNSNNLGKLRLKKDVEIFFKEKFETPNSCLRESYDLATEENCDITIEFTEDLIFSVIKCIAVDTSPGPDRVLMKAIKNQHVAKIITIIANQMLKTVSVPNILQNARTALLHKGGDENDLAKWRPITICSVIRRINVRQYIELNEYQRGFVMKPGTFVNINIIDGILCTATAKKNFSFYCLPGHQQSFR